MSPRPDAAAAGNVLRAALREPLVHFLAAGVVLFVAAGVLRDNERPLIQIDERELAQIAGYWQAQSQRPPTPEELQGLVRERIDEEILAQEAIRLGYDKDDIIIRRRLAQKMAFAGEEGVPIPEPNDEVLKAFYEKTKAAYAMPAHMAIRHVFFSADRGDAEAAARRALAAAKAGEAPAGDPSMLPTTYADVSGVELRRDYGRAFATLAETAPAGQWVGPVASSFGSHILRVEQRRAALTRPFEDVRYEVREAWLADRRAAAQRTYMERLRSRYRVEIARGASPIAPAPMPD